MKWSRFNYPLIKTFGEMFSTMKSNSYLVQCLYSGNFALTQRSSMRIGVGRGLYGDHQFSKLEMLIFYRPEESESNHEELIKIEEELFSSLGLHYKTMDMASGYLGATAYCQFDVEAWMPGLGQYSEISSASNCRDYQSRQLGIRFRPSEPSPISTNKGKANLQY